MKKIKQYLKKFDFILDNYILFKSFQMIKNEKPKEITLYVTNRCNSRCKNCNIWQIQPKIDLKLETIERLLTDKIIGKDTFFILQGGELVLHPQYEKILELFKKRKFGVLSNGILPEKIIEMCKKFKVTNLTLSLDGRPETNKKIRGIDNFEDILKIVKTLRKDTNLGITYTICPENNNIKDFSFVKNFCKHYNLTLNVVIYGTPFYFQVEKRTFLIDNQIIKAVEDKYQKKYLMMFNNYFKYKIPCLSIRKQTTIWADGTVTLCQQKDIILGNLSKNNLSEIWNSPKAEKLRREYLNCNECWLACHRKFDVYFFENESIFKNLFKKIIKY